MTIHLIQCEEQEPGKPCICDLLLDALHEEEVNARIHDEILVC